MKRLSVLSLIAIGIAIGLIACIVGYRLNGAVPMHELLAPLGLVGVILAVLSLKE